MIMEEQALYKLYQEYLSNIFEVNVEKTMDDEELVRYFNNRQRYQTLNENNGTSRGHNAVIYDILTGAKTARLYNVTATPDNLTQGVINASDALGYKKSYDIYGRVVNLDRFPVPSDLKGVKRLPVISRKKLFGEEQVFFNDVSSTYERAYYSPLYFTLSYDYGPYLDFHNDAKIPLESKDYILFVSESGDVYLYRKVTKTYEKLEYDQNEELNSAFNINKDIIKLNNTYYYITPYEIIDITHLMKDVIWHPEISAKLLVEKIISFDQFKENYRSNREFIQLLRAKIKEEKTEKAKKDLEETKRIEEEEHQLKVNQRKKEILQTIKKLLEELAELNKDLATDGDNLEVDTDILFIEKEDHKEINPLFANYLDSIDFHGVSFRNVKVSGLDFSNSNAIIDPQEVYQKDMSNGNYSGLDFNASNFTGVDIRNSDFSNCTMDFALTDNAIKDENTILPTKKTVQIL